ncbi:hypothetical protein [Streptomyces heilongjiangensis]|uniref:hypothetical protein n=1 Tax=Streptomyces heilongjiangensis TaxID=945052 RepID=UPI0036D3FB79
MRHDDEMPRRANRTTGHRLRCWRYGRKKGSTTPLLSLTGVISLDHPHADRTADLGSRHTINSTALAGMPVPARA